MPTNVWLGCTAARQQIVRITPASVGIGDVFTLTVTSLDDGRQVQVQFTATEASVAHVVAGLRAAWNAEADPLCTQVLAVDLTTYLELRAVQEGVPFQVAGSSSASLQNEKQRLAIVDGTPISGSFTLAFGGYTTDLIAYNAAAGDVQFQLVALPSLGFGTCVCTGGPLPNSPIDIEFTGLKGNINQPLLVATDIDLSAGTPQVTTLQDGGADSLTVETTTSNLGPHDWNVPDNWSLRRIPQSGDDVYIPPGAPAILYGLNQAAVLLSSLRQEDGHSGQIGRWSADEGVLYYLRIHSGTVLQIRGNGSLVAIDCGSAAVSPLIQHTGLSGALGRHVVYLKGTALGTLDHRAGDSIVAGFPGDTSVITGGCLVTGGTLTLTTGCTVTGTSARVKGTQSTLISYVAVPTVFVQNGAVYRQEAGTWTSATLYRGGTVYANATGTYGTTTLYDGATLIADETLLAKTFTTTHVNGTATRRYVPALTTWVTLNENAIPEP